MKAEQIDEMIEAYDKVRQRFQPTNGENIAVFTVLVADVLADAGELADELYPPVERVLKTRALDGEALRVLFTRCGMTLPKRRRA